MARVLKAKLQLDTADATRNAKKFTGSVEASGKASEIAGKLGVASYLSIGAAIGAATKLVVELDKAEAAASRARVQRAENEIRLQGQRFGEEQAPAFRRLAGLQAFGGNAAQAAAFGRRGAERFPLLTAEQFAEIAFPLIAQAGSRDKAASAIAQAATFSQAFAVGGGTAGELATTLRRFEGIEDPQKLGAALGRVAGGAEPSERVGVSEVAALLQVGIPQLKGVDLPGKIGLSVALGTTLPSARFARTAIRRIAQIPQRALGQEGDPRFVRQLLTEAGLTGNEVDAQSILFAAGDFLNKATSDRDRISRRNQLRDRLGLSPDQVNDINLASTAGFRDIFEQARAKIFTPEETRRFARANITEAATVRAAEIGAGAPAFEEEAIRGGFVESDLILAAARQEVISGTSREERRRRQEAAGVNRVGGFFTDPGPTEDELDNLAAANRLFPGLVKGLKVVMTEHPDIQFGGQRMGVLSGAAQAEVLLGELRRTRGSANSLFEFVGTPSDEINNYVNKTLEVIRFLRGRGFDVKTAERPELITPTVDFGGIPPGGLFPDSGGTGRPTTQPAGAPGVPVGLLGGANIGTLVINNTGTPVSQNNETRAG